MSWTPLDPSTEESPQDYQDGYRDGQEDAYDSVIARLVAPEDAYLIDMVQGLKTEALKK